MVNLLRTNQWQMKKCEDVNGKKELDSVQNIVFSHPELAFKLWKAYIFQSLKKNALVHQKIEL